MQRCHFCKSLAIHRCTFKKPDPRIIFPDEIRPLDFVRDDLSLIYRPVKVIHPWPRENQYALVQFAGDLKTSVIERFVNVNLPCLRMEIHECGLPTCENHVREIDEGLLICPDHWPQVEQVYSVE